MPTLFKPGDRVIHLVHIGDQRLANGPRTVVSSSRGRVRISGGCLLVFDERTGHEVGPANPKTWSELIHHE